MYITYRGFIYDVMLWRHYWEEINNGCWSSAVTGNNNQILVAKVAESAEIYHRLSAVCKSETLVWWDMGSSSCARKPVVISAVEARFFTKPWEIQLQARVWFVFSWTDKELFLWTLCLGTWMQAYCTLLSDQLQPVICKKWRGLVKKGVILQHDNDFHHSAHLSDSRENKEMGWELLQHLQYSPELAPNAFHLFGPLKELFGGIIWQQLKRRCSTARPEVSIWCQQRLLCYGLQLTSGMMGTLYWTEGRPCWKVT